MARRMHNALRKQAQLLYERDKFRLSSVHPNATRFELPLRVQDHTDDPRKGAIYLGMVSKSSGNGDVAPQ